MVTQKRMSQEQMAAMSYTEREDWHRERLIAQGIAWGMPKTREWVKEPEAEWEDTPEEIAEDIRVSRERLAELDSVPDIDFLEEIDREYPEIAEFFRKMDERFPNGFEWIDILDPDSVAGEKFFAKLEVEFPEAWNYFLADEE